MHLIHPLLGPFCRRGVLRPNLSRAMSVFCSVNDPYQAGQTLQLYFRPEPISVTAPAPYRMRDADISSELCPDWTEGFTPLQICIIKAYSPFTSAVVLLVKPLDVLPSLSVPKQFILKLADRRFGYRDQERPQLVWKPEIEPQLRNEIRNLIGPGPGPSNPIPPKYDGIYAPELPNGDVLPWDGWELEVHVWAWKHASYVGEALAYRHLRDLQGDCIPRLYGTVRLPIATNTTFLHPSVDFVSGLAMEHMRGPNMGDVKPGVDISEDVAQRTSQRLIDNVARIRDAYCRHNDLRLPNIVLRHFPHDPWPVIIDFGLASIIEQDEPVAEWYGGVNEAAEMRKTLTFPDYPIWHIASPYQQRVYERRALTRGYAAINSEIEAIPAHVRATQFERVPNSDAPDARNHMLVWHVRDEVRTQDDYLYQQGCKRDAQN
ncbi:hypothetical protein C8R47DRAFT_1315737 [Mycena vitilis]|nr:hypothetical protein C8R47DRAFT_1315737 [Mycena vitilis]